MLDYKEQLTGLLDSMTECVDICQEKKTSNVCDAEYKEMVNLLIESFVNIQETVAENLELSHNQSELDLASEKFARNLEYIALSINRGNEEIDKFMFPDFTNNFESWKNIILESDISES